jgi:hypothetical protein
LLSPKVKYSMVLMFLLSLVGVSHASDPQKGETFWLKKFAPVDKNTTGSIGGFFMLGMGAIGGNLQQEMSVTFSYGLNNVYKFRTVPLKGITMVLHSHLNNPYVGYVGRDCDADNCFDVWEVHCQENQWPTDITLPLNMSK